MRYDLDEGSWDFSWRLDGQHRNWNFLFHFIRLNNSNNWGRLLNVGVNSALVTFVIV